MARSLSLARVFDRVGYRPHSGQQAILEAKGTHRFRIVCAGRRTGKSHNGGHELTAHAYEAYFRRHELDPYTNRMEYWIVGPEYSDAEKEFRVLWSDLERLEFPFDHPGSYYDANGGNMHLSLFGGRFQVHAKSAKYPDTLVGEGLDGVILAEAAKLKPSIWPKFIRPMLVDTRGWAQMSSTPEGKNWFYDEYMRAHSEPDYWSIRMPSWTNNILFPGGINDPEVQSLGAGLTEEAFKQEIGAEFSEFVGQVFKNFDDQLHARRLKFNPNFQTYAAVDYGWTNPFVWLLIQVDHWDNIYILNEMYKSHLLVEDAAAELRSLDLAPASLLKFYPDPASPGDTAALERALRVPSGGGTGGELKVRLDMIRKWLEIPKPLQALPYGHPDRQPKLFVDPVMCPNVVREFGAYRYPENKREQDRNDSELPLKKDDHTLEALGRFMVGHFGMKQENVRARRRKGSFADR